MARFVTALVDAAPLGGKAGRLAQLIAAGLPVPDGVVLGADAFAAITGQHGPVALDAIGHRVGELLRAVDEVEPPPALAAEVASIAARLAPLAVRSSMSVEDGATGAAPGVFHSGVDVAAPQVWDAIRAVWRGALGPLAIAYARGAAMDVAVILQRFVPGQRVTIYTRPPGHPDEATAWIEPAGEPLRRVDRTDDDPLLRLALAAERAIDAAAGADVEAVVGADATWLVQARPIVHPAVAPRACHRRPCCCASPPTRRACAGGATSSTTPIRCRRRRLAWSTPSSPRAPRQRGSTWSPARSTTPTTAPMHPAAPRADDALPDDGPALRARFDALAAAMMAPLDALPAAPSVAEAVEAYVAAYRVFTHELSPLVRRARALRAATAPRPPSALDAALRAAARGALAADELAARVGDFAPAWDVAVPTFAERPALIATAVLRLRAALAERDAADATDALHPPDPPDAPRAAVAAVAAAIAEDDDALFARAQAIVRRALLNAGRRAGLEDPEDVCWLPLGSVITGDALADPVRARAQAAAARRAAWRARAWDLPLELEDGAAITARAAAGDRWLGAAGSGGRIRGVIHRLDELTGAVHLRPGAIALAATVTPALALLLAGAAGLITGHGGALDHGAAMARELGIPCVVGCADAWALLGDRELVELDGDAATVSRAATAPTPSG